MSNNEKVTPQIRFKGYADAWVRRKLGEVVEKQKSYPLSRDVETQEPTGYRYIHYGDIHKQVADIITKDEQLPHISAGDYLSLEQGDLVLADASEDYIGIAEPSVIIHKPIDNIIAGLHTIALRPRNADSLYLYYLLHTDNFKKFGGLVGTGLKVFGITFANLMLFETHISALPEQNVIGTFFRVLDDAIALSQRKLAGLKKLKAAYLQQMFPQPGARVPRVRCKGFSGEWQTKSASEVFCTVSEKGYSHLPVLSASQEHGMISRDKIGIDIKFDTASKATYKRVLPGQFIIHLRSFQGGLAYSGIEGITSPAYTVLDFADKDCHVPEFWIDILRSDGFVKMLESVTYGIRDGRSISFNDFSILKLSFPQHEEQTAIGNFFLALDGQIAAQSRKIAQTKELKAAYLQQMLI